MSKRSVQLVPVIVLLVLSAVVRRELKIRSRTVDDLAQEGAA